MGGGLLIACSKKITSPKRWKNLFGNDDDNNVLRLAYINMLLHNDGITNLQQMDATFNSLDGENNNNTRSFAQWIKNTKINKVIANPPYEGSTAIDMLENILNNVEPNSKIVWLMPNTKMEKIKKARKILLNNTLTDIIFLGDKIFDKIGCGDVSLFIFEKGKPQNGAKIKCWHVNDGFKKVKNQGYQDVDGNWPLIKNKFLEDYRNGKYDEEIDPSKYLSYQKNFEFINPQKEDFQITILQYMLYKTGRISSQNTVNSLLKLFIKLSKNKVEKNINHNLYNIVPYLEAIDVKHWKIFKISQLFENRCDHKYRNHIEYKKYSKIPKEDGSTPFVSSTGINNGVVRYINLKPNQKNAITISTNGACFDCFYHNYGFCASTDVEILYPRFDMTTEIALFICTVLSKWKGKYNFKNKPKNGIVWESFIKLPVTIDGKPDWLYMEKYIKNIS